MASNDSPLNVHVGGKSATKDADDGPSTIDVVKRDPTNMNQHLKVVICSVCVCVWACVREILRFINPLIIYYYH